ncbi:hypothetical protein MSG28_013092 [Choristoneura fumiferana]|uniref:Uncharacterized protein n=1 Tax=Choristoneura fumiferana TaxID=7141 RepID=A0ACC0KSJ2_CHOFU|nr:hypothetical protein MSG28_013092 [Choristoneura fumiferana]
MPKYYRFRATTPPRKANSLEDKDKERDFFRNERSHERDLTPAQLWYLRRTAWREAPLEPLGRTTRALPAKSLSAAAVARLTAAAAAGQPIFVVKLRSKIVTQYF